MDIQSLLLEMRKEQREDHDRLVEKVDDGFRALQTSMTNHEVADVKAFSAIDNRLLIVENMRRTIRWLGATAVGGSIAAVADYFVNHYLKH